LDSDGALCQDVRIALASVAPKPIRAFESEKMLIGNLLSPLLISQAACSASLEANPITDVYGPDWYKRQMVKVLTKRAILEATKRIRGKDEI
jgi:carbon-monoxide dehydrogenase medium subunit